MNYVLQYANGSLVGIDLSSGGYPYEAYNPTDRGTLGNVEFFHSKEAAERYNRTFSNQFEVKEFVFQLKPA